MTEISASTFIELYLDTVGRCTSEELLSSDGELAYDLFEVADVGVRSFLDPDASLDRLRDADDIDDQACAMSIELRDKYLMLIGRTWTLDDVRTDSGWRELFDLADRLKRKLDPRSTQPAPGTMAVAFEGVGPNEWRPPGQVRASAPGCPCGRPRRTASRRGPVGLARS